MSGEIRWWEDSDGLFGEFTAENCSFDIKTLVERDLLACCGVYNGVQSILNFGKGSLDGDG